MQIRVDRSAVLGRSGEEATGSTARPEAEERPGAMEGPEVTEGPGAMEGPEVTEGSEVTASFDVKGPEVMEGFEVTASFDAKKGPEVTAQPGGTDATDSAARTATGERPGADLGPESEGSGPESEGSGLESEGSGPEAGMVTAEYAIATLAAAAFAGVLLVILRSAEVRAFLLGIIRQALSV